ncbi:hypothetical protein ACIPYU_07600 [Paenarthrobacter nicotinovorans]|uniref:hypothetical protein n=1 Tax=Paenarthrobacter nicotinovorans TaxID=29320 RepID=UPI0037F7020B
MNYHRSGYAKTATLASLALALTLTACAPATPRASTSITQASEASTQAPATVADPEQVLPTPEPSTAEEIGAPFLLAAPLPAIEGTLPRQEAATIPAVAPEPVAVPQTPAAAPLPPATPLVPEVVPVSPVVPSTPHTSLGTPVTGTYTFPDGHISFDLPAGWSAKIEQDDYNENANHPGGKENSLAATIFDETGSKVARITSGGTGGLVGGPVNRTILDSQELSAFESRDGASHFAFVRDDYPFPEFPVRYYMGVVSSYFMTEGPDSTSVNSFMIMPNGLATAVAEIDESMTAETAEAWMKTDQYIKLRALLTSLRYAA